MAGTSPAMTTKVRGAAEKKLANSYRYKSLYLAARPSERASDAPPYGARQDGKASDRQT
jgi:hypothetical protein